VLADPNTRSSTHTMEYLSRMQQHQAHHQPRSTHPLYKNVPDSTGRSHIHPIWLNTRHGHTFCFVHSDSHESSRLMRFPSDGVLGPFFFTATYLHIHLASCLFLYTIPHDAHVNSIPVYSQWCLFSFWLPSTIA
jgi:hypothetical protein